MKIFENPKVEKAAHTLKRVGRGFTFANDTLKIGRAVGKKLAKRSQRS